VRRQIRPPAGCYNGVAMATLLESLETPALVVKMPSSVVEMNDDQFFDFCQANRELRIERTADGDILIMSPTGSRSGSRNAKITMRLGNWAERTGTGIVFDSSSGFRLPNGATRSPDAAWVLKSRLQPFSIAEREKFLPICPDFVIELKSPTDRLEELKNKLREYLDNGARLGWLLNPELRQVLVYRPAGAVELLDHPEAVSGDPELPGFVLELKEIWDPES
jgi:Uma2 family endonuclease